MNTKQISVAIKGMYQSGDYLVDLSGHVARATFKVDGLRITCDNTLAAVHAVTEKYRKGIRFENPIPTTPRIQRRFSIALFREFMRDGEMDNALNYAELFNYDSLASEVTDAMHKIKFHDTRLAA